MGQWLVSVRGGLAHSSAWRWRRHVPPAVREKGGVLMQFAADTLVDRLRTEITLITPEQLIYNIVQPVNHSAKP